MSEMSFRSARTASVFAALVAAAILAACSARGTQSPIPVAGAMTAQRDGVEPVGPAVSFAEYPIPTSQSAPTAITSAGDDVWFTEYAGNKIGRASESGKIDEFAIANLDVDESAPRPRPQITTPPNGYAPIGIALGYDNALWITEENASAVARMTQAGKVTKQYRVTSKCCLQYISRGPGRALWFAISDPSDSSGPNVVAKMTGGGAVSQFKVANASLPGFVTEGPDGALWFTQQGSNQIGRMTTDGKVTNEYRIPTQDSQPGDIVEGPDRALWFTELSGNKIGRVTTAGTLSEYAVPTSGAGPAFIVNGPGKALWFTEAYGNKIGEITVSGKFTEYAVPTANSEPFGIAVDRSGAIWFTEHAANKIGRLRLP